MEEQEGEGERWGFEKGGGFGFKELVKRGVEKGANCQKVELYKELTKIKSTRKHMNVTICFGKHKRPPASGGEREGPTSRHLYNI